MAVDTLTRPDGVRRPVPLPEESVRRRLFGVEPFMRPILLEESILCRVCAVRDGLRCAYLDARFTDLAAYTRHFRREHPEWVP